MLFFFCYTPRPEKGATSFLPVTRQCFTFENSRRAENRSRRVQTWP